jgi:hypothetical protein
MKLTLNEVVEKCEKMFRARYGKRFAELNKNVYPATQNEKGNFEIPVVSIGQMGGTMFVGHASEAVKLNPAAPVSILFRNTKPLFLIYRMAIPYGECEIAAQKPEYFNYLFDEIVTKGINNLKATVGDENKVRFGKVFCTYEKLDDTKRIFHITESNDLELRLTGCWGSNEEAYD